MGLQISQREWGEGEREKGEREQVTTTWGEVLNVRVRGWEDLEAEAEGGRLSARMK